VAVLEARLTYQATMDLKDELVTLCEEADLKLSFAKASAISAWDFKV
jgi:hypothetical protein